jgi:hypothetical protein
MERYFEWKSMFDRNEAMIKEARRHQHAKIRHSKDGRPLYPAAKGTVVDPLK